MERPRKFMRALIDKRPRALRGTDVDRRHDSAVPKASRYRLNRRIGVVACLAPLGPPRPAPPATSARTSHARRGFRTRAYGGFLHRKSALRLASAPQQPMIRTHQALLAKEFATGVQHRRKRLGAPRC